MSTSVAKVIVDVPTRALTEPFDYDVPEGLSGSVEVGSPVYVPFGKSHAVGYVVALGSESDVAERKPIAAVLGDPLFMPWASDVARWIAEEYACPLSEAMRLFLPPGGSVRVERTYRVLGERPAKGVKAAVYDAVAAAGELTGGRIARLAPSAPAAASALVSDGALERTYALVSARVGAITRRWVSAVPGSGYAPPGNATLQRAVLDALEGGPTPLTELVIALGSGVSGAVTRLAAAGAVTVEDRHRERTPGVALREAVRHEKLSGGQQDSLDAIASAAAGSSVLLDGVTASGKTEVYMRAIEGVLDAGGTAIVLVPEISLTPQTVGRFRSRFGDTVAIVHSRLGQGERYDEWHRARSGRARVMVGPRSALFAPLEGVRLIVIDEEHETSYKQGSAPRYHARDVAGRICDATGAVLVLGTATPSLESLAAVGRGECARVVLPERVGGGALPPVRVVDMTAEFAEGHRSMFSRPLIAGLEAVKVDRAKAVLLLNRRGFAAFLLCRECGFVPSCESCSVSLTYHERGDRLVCHHCGATSAVPAACPRCGSPYLRQFGAGTQRVESELAGLMPGMPVVRMDADTTAGKGGHERALAAFEGLEWGVLVGTQMIAKGLDYPDVTLVGVLNADTGLHLPDFRAAERTYQLLAQVAGRAGRGVRGGEVVFQTYWPDHPAVVAASKHHPGSFYAAEAAERAALGYPPHGRLANVTLSGADGKMVSDAAAAVADALRASCPGTWQVLGPAPAVLSRVKGSWRWHVLVKAPRDARLGPALRDALAVARLPAGVSAAPDVDPYDLM